MNCLYKRQEQGAALVTSLLLLLVLTVIGITAMQMSRMQERMAGSSRDMNLAFQGAEAALRNGEALAFGLNTGAARCTGIPCTTSWSDTTNLVDNPQANTDDTWWNNYGIEYQASGDRTVSTKELTDLENDPRFVVQYLARVDDSLAKGSGDLPTGRDFYVVTARSTGASGKANTILQSTFARR